MYIKNSSFSYKEKEENHSDFHGELFCLLSVNLDNENQLKYFLLLLIYV